MRERKWLAQFAPHAVDECDFERVSSAEGSQWSCFATTSYVFFLCTVQSVLFDLFCTGSDRDWRHTDDLMSFGCVFSPISVPLPPLPRRCCDKWAVQTAPWDQKVPRQGLLLWGALPHHLLPLHGQLWQRETLRRGAPRSTQRHLNPRQQGTALCYDTGLVHLGFVWPIGYVQYHLSWVGSCLFSHNLSRVCFLCRSNKLNPAAVISACIWSTLHFPSYWPSHTHTDGAAAAMNVLWPTPSGRDHSQTVRTLARVMQK